MIHPSQLTKEAGFEDGVVMEIHFGSSNSFDWIDWNEHSTKPKIIEWITGGAVVSIRPLTGDMAIWNFAPEWAEWLVNWGDSIQWGVNEDNAGSGIMIKRPWWAK